MVSFVDNAPDVSSDEESQNSPDHMEVKENPQLTGQWKQSKYVLHEKQSFLQKVDWLEVVLD